MFERLKELVLKWLGIKLGEEPAPVEEFSRRYEDIHAENITAIIANKLAMLTFADSSFRVEGEGARVEFLRDQLEKLWSRDCQWITAQMLGKGGKLLIPTVADGSLHIAAIDQSRLRIVRQQGDKITSALLHVDSTMFNERRYDLYASYALEGGAQTIRYRILERDSSMEVSPGVIPAWPLPEPEISIANTDRLLFAYLRCPRDNRRDFHRYGVPITYGADALLQELADHVNIYKREFKLTRPMLGLDSTLWQRTSNFGDKTQNPARITEIRKTVQDSDDPFIPLDSSNLSGNVPWQLYSPAIRHEAMERRYLSLCRRVEKACGLSQGILTERQTMNYANRDEVRAAQYDTFSVIRSIRNAWESAFDDLAYSIDVLAERFNLTPAGARDQASLAFDWDQSLIESTQQTFEQMSELQSRGMISDAELRQWVMGGSMEDAEEAIEQIREQSGKLNNPLGSSPLGSVLEE